MLRPQAVHAKLPAARRGVYIHFPYCLSKCSYCDFASTTSRSIPEARYTAAVLAEFQIRAEAFNLHGQRVESIYIGGGTPSLWQPTNVGRILNALADTLHVASNAEITLEANPNACTAKRFSEYRARGITRLSLGVQSFQPAILKVLGRTHDSAAALQAFAAARTAGFGNISMDFIYGTPGQTIKQVETDAQKALALAPEHLSAYALTLDGDSLAEVVPLAKKLASKTVTLPNDEAVLQMQHLLSDMYAKAGLRRYEVSNYARASMHSRHNALYWTGGEYLALGASATGFLTQVTKQALRYTNHRNTNHYCSEVEAKRLPEASRERISNLEYFQERVAMGLRMTTGIDLEALCHDFGQDVTSRRKFVHQLVEHKLATYHRGRLMLTPAGFDVHSAIAARLM